MILEGNERGHGAELARHLLNPSDNDHVTVHAVEGFVAEDLFEAFGEAEAISQATQCQKYLFSLSFNPPPGDTVPVEVFEEAIAAVERKLGLVGQPRAVVFHEKLGRRHAHCVWSRIDASTMKAIKLSHYKRKLMDISRDLYRANEWDMPEGFKDQAHRDPLNYSRQEAGQAKRTTADPAKLKAMFRRCWEQSDSQSSFAAALWSEGYVLARGERRGFVAVDADGTVWSLSRWCGVKPKELRARLGSEGALWSVEDAKLAFAELWEKPAPDQSRASSQGFEEQRAALVERQRRERADLLAVHEARRTKELKDRQSSLPTGLKAVWTKLTGKHQALVHAFAEQKQQSDARDRAELQKMIERHLKERRALDHQIRIPDFLAELNATFDGVSQPDPRQRLIFPKDDIPFSRNQLLKNPSLILDHVSYKRARFGRTDVLRELAKRIDDPMALILAADTALKSPELIQLGGSDTEDLTTKDFLSAEDILCVSSAALSKLSGMGVDRNYIKSAISAQNREMQSQFGGNLSDEQRNALHHILGPQQFACVVGLAGSGKSTLLKTAMAAWSRQGIKVHGAALAGKAAEGLQTASGIESRTLASLEASWANGYESIARGDVLVVDEAGMLGTRQLMRVANKMQNIGAKLVLVGDPDQLQPIEAGKPFKALIETHGTARLSEIHRQKEDWQRRASRDLAEGRIREAVQSYEERGAVRNRFNLQTAVAALVENYVSDMELNGSKVSQLAFAHRRKDVYGINQAIRAAIRSSGEPDNECLFETDTGPRAFAKGDRIVFTRNDKQIGVKNGMLGTVESVKEDRVSVLLDREGGTGKTVTFSPSKFASFDHGYAVTIHKSQGVTVDRSYVLASKTMDAPLTYVAMTRHREDVKLYLNDQDQPLCLGRLPANRMQWEPSRMRGYSRS